MRHVRRLTSALLLVLVVAVIGCRMSHSPTLGVRSGRLLPCPRSPNCVCSQDPDPAHQVDPFAFIGPGANAWERLRACVEAEPRTRIIESSPGYLRVEFRSLLFRFVDDVEFNLEPTAQLIHVRSASRVGYSDLGANRQRIGRLRQAFEASK